MTDTINIPIPIELLDQIAEFEKKPEFLLLLEGFTENVKTPLEVIWIEFPKVHEERNLIGALIIKAYLTGIKNGIVAKALITE